MNTLYTVARTVLAAAVLALIFQGTAVAAGPGGNDNRKIVVFASGFTGLPAQAALVRGAGGSAVKPLPLVNGFAAVLPPAAQAALAGRAEVLRVDDDIVISAIKKPSWAGGGGDSGGSAQTQDILPWGVDRIDADIAWGGAEFAADVTTADNGNFVKVAVVDTGIDLSHPDLDVYGNVNIINPRKSGRDDNGHGTHVAGIIAALDNQLGVIGTAPKAHLYAVKVLDAAGNGWLSDLVDGLAWCINNKMQVINMSLGASSDNATFHQAVIAAYNAGITMAAAAGNSGTSGLSYPGRYAETIGVSATDSNDDLASYSSYGPEVDLAAPGSSIYSTYKGGGYATLSGTSMATPHVAGVAALVLGRYANMNLTPAEVKAHLKNTAYDIGLPANKMGAGLVDAQWAVQTSP